ncbi:hypothetical protein EDC04DRAFT_1561214 [Pisolithus marmoratus]|nr:hypothetical protein EDC04DRAFT_1561214 [Pisolithus marmoratus]
MTNTAMIQDKPPISTDVQCKLEELVKSLNANAYLQQMGGQSHKINIADAETMQEKLMVSFCNSTTNLSKITLSKPQLVILSKEEAEQQLQMVDIRGQADGSMKMSVDNCYVMGQHTTPPAPSQADHNSPALEGECHDGTTATSHTDIGNLSHEREDIGNQQLRCHPLAVPNDPSSSEMKRGSCPSPKDLSAKDNDVEIIGDCFEDMEVWSDHGEHLVDSSKKILSLQRGEAHYINFV